MIESSPILSINDLHITIKSHYGSHTILRGVNLSIASGEILALVGESGCGKSVTAQAVLQLLGPSATITQGEILFEGIALHTKSNREMKTIRGKKIGMVFQDPMTSLNPTLTVGHQIAEMLVVHEHLPYRQARLKAIELLKRVGIAEPMHRFDAYPFQLSGGMRQRILIAIALACRPTLLIADEPTTALDVTIQAQILELLQEMQEETGMSLLLITHDLAIVAAVCDRAAIMKHGQIVEVDAINKIFNTPKHSYTQTLLEVNPRNPIRE